MASEEAAAEVEEGVVEADDSLQGKVLLCSMEFTANLAPGFLKYYTRRPTHSHNHQLSRACAQYFSVHEKPLYHLLCLGLYHLSRHFFPVRGRNSLDLDSSLRSARHQGHVVAPLPRVLHGLPH